MKTLLLCLVTILLTSCSSKNISEISAKELHTKMQKGSLSEMLIDVRTPGEVSGGIIQGAIVKNYHDDDLEKYISKLDKSKTYIVYCAVGGRSGKMVELMSKKNLKAINLKGGITKWKSLGYKVSPLK